VRLVYGDSDGMAPLVHGEWLRARLPNSELHIIPGGHGDATFGAAADAFEAIASA
jgi:pimeloyl-ACP methyl ester carboxylesterase